MQHPAFEEVTFQHHTDEATFKKKVRNTTILLSVITIFMHLGDEIRNMIMTIVVPLLLFIWFIGAFIWDGNSYKNLRNTYDKHYKESTMPTPHKGGH